MLYRFTVPGELVKLYIQGFFIYFKLLKKKSYHMDKYTPTTRILQGYKLKERKKQFTRSKKLNFLRYMLLLN